MVVYAKHTGESLREHVDQLLSAWAQLQGSRRAELDALLSNIPWGEWFWPLLRLAAVAHDLGKVYTPFQNMIRKKRGEPLLPQDDLPDVPHNLLSPCFLFKLKDRLPELLGATDIPSAHVEYLWTCFLQSVAYHHDRDREEELLANPRRWVEDVRRAIEGDVRIHYRQRLAPLEDLLPVPTDPTQISLAYRNTLVNRLRNRRENLDVYRFYLLLKGLLHRLDHSASANVDCELSPVSLGPFVDAHFQRKGISQPWQRDHLPSTDENIVLIAGTGSGKTEFALLWLGQRKGIYTLPVRTSINAMFRRFTDENKLQIPNVGLLHADSALYLFHESLRDSDEEGQGDWLRRADLSRQLATPLLVTTADQVFTSVLKYKGYEKIYATLLYSGIVVDEIQSYDPEIAATILRGLVELARLGGRFCLMTATLPPDYLDLLRRELGDQGLCFREYYRRLPQHRITLHPDSIDSPQALSLLQDCATQGRAVLVVVNTVARAQSLFDKLTKQQIKCHLLHARFITKDREEREKELLTQKPPQGIWITTQVAEVSLDVDFPVLLTELAPMDALVQRMGRVRRHDSSPYTALEPNVHMFYGDPSGIGHVYDEEYTRTTFSILSDVLNCETFREPLADYDKQELLRKVFEELPRTGSYRTKFHKAYRLLEDGLEAPTRQEAQKIFRRILQIQVIPVAIYEQHRQEVDEALKILGQKNIPRPKRLQALHIMRNYSVPVPYWQLKEKLFPLSGDYYMTTLRYDPDKGLIPTEQESSFL